MKKSNLILLFIILISLISCTKEVDAPQKNPCEGDDLTVGFKSALVGKWRFYKQKWLFYQGQASGWQEGWKDSSQYFVQYEIEVLENGSVNFFHDGELVKTLTVQFESDTYLSNHPENHIGEFEATFPCSEYTHTMIGYYENTFFEGFMINQDTLALRHQPVFRDNLGTDQLSRHGYYYRID